MGEVVGAGILAHVPTIMLPEHERRALNHGEDFTIGPALTQLRHEVFETLDYDTVVVLDSHWFTTVEFVVTAQDRRSGLFTAEELPRGMCRIPYDWRGDPELAFAVERVAPQHSAWITANDDHFLPMYYPPINLWTFLGAGLDKRWVTVSVAQTGEADDFLRAGRAIGQAIAETDRKVLLIGSGALSHTFWKLLPARPRGRRTRAHLHPRGVCRGPGTHRVVHAGRSPAGPGHHAGLHALPARGDVRPLPHVGRGARGV